MKRLTKAQKEAQQKAALLHRIVDIYSGANGCMVAEDEHVFADTLRRVMVVVKDIWIGEDPNKQFLIAHWNVDEYSTPEKCAEFLYERGRLRA